MTQQPANPMILCEYEAEDYLRNADRCGSPDVAALFPGFQHLD
ncbi:MAG: hypothetical protein ACI89J_001537, partial [Hyphomicrobiaceae bacterium]